MDIKQIQADWQSRGFSCEIWVDQPGQVWEDFVHDVDELVMPIEGKAEFIINGKTYHPKIGEELLIPAKSYHTVKNIGETTSRWLYGYKR